MGVNAVFDDERQAWTGVLEDGREHATFETEPAALLAGIRAHEEFADILLTGQRHVREDDTLLLVHAEQWLEHRERMSP